MEVLESRTLLSGGLGYGHDLPAFVERHAAILESFNPLASSDPISQIVDINTAAQATSNPATCASAPTLTSAGADGMLAGVPAASRSSAWDVDNQGDYVLTGKIFSLDPGGSQDVTITIPGNADDFSNQTDGNSGNNTTGQKPGANGSGGKGKPFLQHPTPNGAPSDGSVSGPTVGPIDNPTSGQDSNSATPAVARSTQPGDNSNSTPAVTPLAMTPAGPGVAQSSSAVVPVSSAGNVSITMASSSAALNAGPTASVHELPHTAEHWLGTLAAVAPQLPLAMILPDDAGAAPVQIATGQIHVGVVANSDAQPDVYVVGTATPSLPARIAYNFVRLDAAAFHDSASAFAAELAALNVTNTGPSHRRAWAITAGVLGVDIALVLYWHRQARLRKQKQSQPTV